MMTVDHSCLPLVMHEDSFTVGLTGFTTRPPTSRTYLGLGVMLEP